MGGEGAGEGRLGGAGDATLPASASLLHSARPPGSPLARPALSRGVSALISRLLWGGGSGGSGGGEAEAGAEGDGSSARRSVSSQDAFFQPPPLLRVDSGGAAAAAAAPAPATSQRTYGALRALLAPPLDVMTPSSLGASPFPPGSDDAGGAAPFLLRATPGAGAEAASAAARPPSGAHSDSALEARGFAGGAQPEHQGWLSARASGGSGGTRAAVALQAVRQGGGANL